MSSSDTGSLIFRLAIIMAACSPSLSWIVFYAALLVSLVSQCNGGCQDAGLCCVGQNRSCVTEGWREDPSYGECYCDQACKMTLDCCHDYDLACPAVPCVVSEWSVWSGCLEACKPTVRTRLRRVIQEARNGGEICPTLQQTAGCAEYQDQYGTCLQSLVPALITTGGYGNARKKREITDANNITGYCVEFEITSLTVGCQQTISPHTHWIRYLKEGHQVCVECQPPLCHRVNTTAQGTARATARLRHYLCNGRPLGTLSAEVYGDGSAVKTPVPALLYTVFSSSNTHTLICRVNSWCDVQMQDNFGYANRLRVCTVDYTARVCYQEEF